LQASGSFGLGQGHRNSSYCYPVAIVLQIEKILCGMVPTLTLSFRMCFTDDGFLIVLSRDNLATLGVV
jgi:hypothetical protein